MLRTLIAARPALLTLVATGALAATAAGTAIPSPDDGPDDGPGDTSHIEFTLPFEQAQAKAKTENRLLFVKPIYGGVDVAGAADYRLGRW